MTPSLPATDLEATVRDPEDHYAAPMDVLKDTRLTDAEKQRVLESWELDAQLLSQAESENMHGDERPRLREVKLALLALKESSPAAK